MSSADRQLIEMEPIGVIRSEHRQAALTPIQPVFARSCRGKVVVDSAYGMGLMGLEGFSHLILLYQLDRADEVRLQVTPYMGDQPVGVFATRHPCRPNRIGLSIVALERVDGLVLHCRGVDILDGTPLLDIKPYVPRFDQVEAGRGGWTDGVDDATAECRGLRGYARQEESEP